MAGNAARPAATRAGLVEFLVGAGGFAANGIVVGRDLIAAQTDRMRWGRVCYLLKGIAPEFRIGTGLGSVTLAEFLGVTPERDLVPVPGKRAGLSQNLGCKARHTGRHTEVHYILGLSALLEQGTRRSREAGAC